MIFKIKVKVAIIDKREKGQCPNGHKIGDVFYIGDKTPEGLCCSAFNAIWSYAKTLLVSQNKKFEGTVCCPDSEVGMEYKLELVS